MKWWVKAILLTLGVFFILFSAIFFLAAVSPDFRLDILVEAVILLILGISPIAVVVYMGRKELNRPMNVTQNINIDAKDLVGGSRDVKDIKCSGCAAPLSSEDVRITDLGIMVKCPYCQKAYVIQEEPKW